MEPDATGHGTRDTEQPFRTALTPDTQDTHNDGVPYATDTRDAATGHGTQDVPHGTLRDMPQNTLPSGVPLALRNGTPARDTGHGTPVAAQDTGQNVPPAATGQDSGTSRNLFRTAVDRTRDAYRARQDAVRSEEDARRVMQRNAERDAQLARDAVSRESAASRRRRGPRPADAPEIAPIPDWMQKAQVWAERLGGTVLKLAPLIVSGYFTYDVGTDAPLNMNDFVALFLVLGLEGSVWYLNRLREKFKLENDSTASIAAAIFGIIFLIAAMIGGHAIWKAAGSKPIMISIPGFTDDVTGEHYQVPLDQLVPAVAIALMSAIGAFIWAKEATYKHRTKLRALGQIDPRAPRISAGAWVFTAWESIWSLRHAFKYRITQSPTDDWRHWKAAGKPKIWPIPEGFRWNGTSLVAIPIEELRDMAERDALLARITGRNTGTGQQDAGQQDAIVATAELGTGRPVSRRELTDGTFSTGVPQQNGTASGTVNGTSRDERNGTHGTSRTVRGTDDEQNASGTPADDNRTHAVGEHGTQDADGTQDGQQDTGGTLTEKGRADILKYGAYLLVVTKAFPDWRTSAKLPAVRRINTAIDAHRKATEGPHAKFNSLDVAGKIQGALENLRRDPSMLDTIRDLETKP